MKNTLIITEHPEQKDTFFLNGIKNDRPVYQYELSWGSDKRPCDNAASYSCIVNWKPTKIDMFRSSMIEGFSFSLIKVKNPITYDVKELTNIIEEYFNLLNFKIYVWKGVWEDDHSRKDHIYLFSTERLDDMMYSLKN